MVQMSFNVAPKALPELDHSLRVDERVLRWITLKQQTLSPLKNFKARDPRNLNTLKTSTST